MKMLKISHYNSYKINAQIHILEQTDNLKMHLTEPIAVSPTNHPQDQMQLLVI